MPHALNGGKCKLRNNFIPTTKNVYLLTAKLYCEDMKAENYSTHICHIMFNDVTPRCPTMIKQTRPNSSSVLS